MSPSRFTTEQKRKEIEREIAMRRSVYRKQVHDGRMSPQEASDRIAIMEDISNDYAIDPKLFDC